jgi:hypothetical protein
MRPLVVAAIVLVASVSWAQEHMSVPSGAEDSPVISKKITITVK